MAESNVPVMQSVRAAYAFWRHAWRPAAGVLALASVVMAVQAYYSFTGAQPLSMLFAFLSVFVSTMASGALFRLAFADERPGDPEFTPGAGGFQWRAMETRLLGASLLIFLFLIIAVVVFVFLVAIAVLLLTGSSGGSADSPEELAEALGPGALLLLLLMLVMVLALIYSAIRLVLALPATATSGKIMVFETWGLTKGQFWPILGAYILVLAPSIAVGVLTSIVADSSGGEAGAAAVQTLPAGVAVLLAAVNGLVGAFVQAPLVVGLSSYLYRGLRPPEAAPSRGVGTPAGAL